MYDFIIHRQVLYGFYLIILIGIPFLSNSQHIIKGSVLDTSKSMLSPASVVVLQKTDSSIVNFALTDDKGNFAIPIEKKGTYLIQYSFLGYKPIIKPITSSWEQKVISLSPAIMIQESIQLSEVDIVAKRIPLKLQGDTLIYDATTFKTAEGADVEKLLELLPGLHIDSKDNLVAQGKIVEKILVNGKEFFGNSIEIAIKNLDAEMVNKVEVFDKQSEDAEFTGVNDGLEKRTINLELKEEYKAGGFGRLEAAIGTDETFSGRMNYNHFNETTQFSIVGNGNNINQQSVRSISNLSPNFGSSGIVDRFGGGGNINHEFNSNIKANFNYLFEQQETTLERKSLSQNFTDSSTFETNQISNNESMSNTHRFKGDVKWKINQNTETSVQSNVTISDRNTLNSSSTLYTPPLNGSVISNDLEQSNDQLNFSLRFDLRRKFEEKGRSWITNYNITRNTREEESSLLNITFGEELVQLQNFKEVALRSRVNTTYIEPIGKQWFLSSSYQFNFENNSPTRSFFDIANNSLEFNDDLSSSFERLVHEHSIEEVFRQNTKKLNSNIGFRALNTNLVSAKLNRNFKLFLPFLTTRYKFSPSKSIQFSYTTRSQTPQLNQLISITNNINPNQSYIGNPNLKPEYNHTIRLNYYHFNSSTQTSYNAGVSINRTFNKITTQTNINEDLTSSTSPINTDFYQSVSLDGGLSGNITVLNLKYRIASNIDVNEYDAFLNERVSRVRTLTNYTRFVLSRHKKEQWDLQLGVNYSLSQNNFEANPSFNQQAFNFNWFANGELEITETLLFQAKYRIQRLNSVSFFKGRALHFVNASLRKSFTRSKWDLFVLVNDLLNQGLGIQRNSTINSLSEEIYTSRQQYIMFGASRRIKRKKASIH